VLIGLGIAFDVAGPVSGEALITFRQARTGTRRSRSLPTANYPPKARHCDYFRQEKTGE